MSRTAPSDLERIALVGRCGRCDAPRGLWCRVGTAYARDLHFDRIDPVRQAYGLGYEEGAEEVRADWHNERALLGLTDARLREARGLSALPPVGDPHGPIPIPAERVPAIAQGVRPPLVPAAARVVEERIP